MYIKDLEGNPLEFYVDSPFYTAQPCREALDLNAPTNEILSQTEAMCRRRPGFMTREDWMASIRMRIEEERAKL
jgi:hypothetical protein